jgi:hypothetical protein
MEQIIVRIDPKIKQQFRLNCMKHKRSMQFILDKLVVEWNAKEELKEKNRMLRQAASE